MPTDMTELYVGLAGVEAAIVGILAGTLFFSVEVSTSQFTYRATRAVIGQRLLWVFGIEALLAFSTSLVAAIRTAFPDQDFVAAIDLHLDSTLTDGWWAVACVVLTGISGVLFAAVLVSLSRLLNPLGLANWFASTGEAVDLSEYALFTEGLAEVPPPILLEMADHRDQHMDPDSQDGEVIWKSLSDLRDHEVERLRKKSANGELNNPLAPTLEMMSRSVSSHDVETYRSLAFVYERQLIRWIAARSSQPRDSGLREMTRRRNR